MKDRLELFVESILDYLDGVDILDKEAIVAAISHAHWKVKLQDQNEFNKGGETRCQL